MKGKLLLPRVWSLSVLLALTLLFSTASTLAETKKEATTQEAKTGAKEAGAAPESTYATVEPIVVVFRPSADQITTGSAPYLCLHGKHFDSLIFIAHSKEPQAGSATVIARDLETNFGKLEYDLELAQQLNRTSGLRIALDSHARLDSSLAKPLAELRRLLGEFRAVVLLANLENAAQAERLAGSVAEVTFGKHILIAGVANADIDIRELPVSEDRRVLAFDEKLEQFVSRQMTTEQEKKMFGASQEIAKALHGAARNLGYNHLLVDPRAQGVGEISLVDVLAYKPLSLSEAQKESLLKIARRSLEEYVRTEKPAKLEAAHDVLSRREAGFVTLTENDDLRGCIGTIFPVVPIAEVVNTNAVRAAVSDPRFPPVTADELKKIKVEVTVFTSRMKRLRSVEEIEIGRDGLYMRKGYNSGIFLPQVPVQFGWDRMQYLQHLCGKAGLPPGAWKDAEVFRYTAIHFGEK